MGADSTGTGFVDVVASDTVDIPKKNGNYPRALRFGTGGTCTLLAIDDSSAVVKNIANGETIDVDCKRVMLTGLTGCADIVGIY